MKTSIITVTYNSGAAVRSAIESLLLQHHVDVEYIIVDGGSTDNTLSIVQEYRDKIDVVISEPDEGIYDAMNKGLQVATGDIVGILNSDDYYCRSSVLLEVEKKFKESNVDIVFGDIVFVNSDAPEKILRHYSVPRFKPWWLKFGIMPPHPGAFIRKKLFDVHGYYPTNYEIAADYERFVKFLWKEKASYTYLNQIIMNMRVGGRSNRDFVSRIKLNSEIIRACMVHGLYTNYLYLMLKLPFRLLELSILR